METEELGFETICKLFPILEPAPYEGDVLKHQEHDQQTHGNWATGFFDRPEGYNGLDVPDGELPETVYHVTSSKNDEKISQTGLQVSAEDTWNIGASQSEKFEDGWIWGKGENGEWQKEQYRPAGVYVFRSLESAKEYAGTDSSIYAIDTKRTLSSGADVIRDPSWSENWDYMDDPEREQAFVFNNVPQNAVARLVLKHAQHNQQTHGSWATGQLSEEQKAAVSGWTSLSNKAQWRQIANDLSEGKTPNASESDIKTVETLVNTVKQNGVIPMEALGFAALLTTGLRWQGTLPKVGDTLKNELSSATIDDKVAERFSQYTDFDGAKGKPVVFHYGLRTKGLDVNRTGADTFADEKEWLVSGNFTVTNKYSEKGITHLNLKPISSFEKHGTGDQKPHGNWATGSRGSDITNDCKSYFGTDVMSYQTSEAKIEIQKRSDAARIAGKGHENYILEIVAEKQGFDGKPKVVSSDEIDQLEKEGWTVAYRGIQDYQQRGWDAVKYSAINLAEEFKTGNYHAGAGTDGDGLYFTTDKSVAESYAFSGEYGGIEGVVVKVAIPPNSTLTANQFNEVITSHREKINKGGVGDFWGADDIGVSLASKGVRGAQSLRRMQNSFDDPRIAPVFVIWDRSMLAVEKAKSK